MYCVKCKRKTQNGPISYRMTKNNRKMAVSPCGVCGTKKTNFVKK